MISLADQAKNLISSLGNLADYLEIRFEDRKALQIMLNEKGVRGISRSNRVGGCIRACYKGGWGFASFADLSRMKALSMEAIQMARTVGTSSTRLAQIKPIVDHVPLHIIKDPRETSISDKISKLDHYRELMLGRQPELVKAIGLSYQEEFLEKTLLTSEGTHISQASMELGLSYNARALLNGQQTMMFGVTGSTDDFEFLQGLDENVMAICDQAALYSKAPKIRGGVYTVVLDPELAGVFAHESFGHTSEADLFAEKPGGLDTLKIGKRFGTDELNIYDTGLLKGRAGDSKYDDEGVPTHHTDLIKEGILVGRMHNRETAASLHEEPTGNARAMNYHFPPIVRMRNTCIGPGKHEVEDLFRDIKEGVYALGCYGGSGGEQFSFSALRGYMIRDGKIAEPVKGLSLMGNLFETLGNIEGIGPASDLQQLSGMCGKHAQFPLSVSMRSPHIRIRNLTIGGY